MNTVSSPTSSGLPALGSASMGRDVADFRQSAWIHIQESLFDGPVPGGLIPFVANDLAKDAEELLSRYLGPDWRRFAHQDSTQRAGAPPTGSDLGHLRAQLEGMAAKGNVDPEWLRLMREALDLVLDHPGDAIMRLRDVKERLLEFYKGGNVVFDAEAIQGIDNPTVKSHLYVVHSLSNLAAHWSADELGPAQAYTAVASLLRALQWFQETA